MRRLLLFACLFLAVSLAAAQNLLPNPSFEEGATSPASWQLKEGTGQWETAGHAGTRCLSVTGDGKDSNYWSTPLPPLTPGATYRLSFWGKLGKGTSGGCVVSGPDFCNRDWGLSDKWQQYSYVFCVPAGRTGGVCRLGQWTVGGPVYFDDVELRRVVPVQQQEQGLTLCSGEQTAGDRYSYQSSFGGPGSNYSPLLQSATAAFNSNRWVFGPGTEVVFKHALPGVEQSAGKVTVSIGWYQSGNCVVEAGRDGQAWQALGQLSGTGNKSFDLPAALLPASVLYVRLRSPGEQETAKDFAPGAFQVYDYAYEATLARALPSVQGATSFLSVDQDAGTVAVEVRSLGSLLPGANKLQAGLRSRAAGKLSLALALDGKVAATGGQMAPAGQPVDLTVPYQVAGAGDHRLQLTVSLDGKPVWQAGSSFFVPTLYSADYGYALAGTPQADLWWCEGTYKVAQTRAAPSKAQPLRLAACRGEFEPCQLVVRPRQPLRNVTATVAAMAGPGGASLPAAAWTVRQVEYLQVTTPTDETSCRGWWPDPLPPFTRGDFTPGRNWPLWLTVKVPADARAGLYRGTVTLSGDGGFRAEVPLQLQVFGFTMPPKPHLQTAWGFSFGSVARYQNLSTSEDRARAFDLCMQDFRDHRIAPYDFFQLAPIKVEVTGSAWQGGEIVADTAAEGTQSLKLVDDSVKGVIDASPQKLLPIRPDTTYTLAFAVKTAEPGQDYHLTLGCHAADGSWFSGRNLDLHFKGTGAWERQEVTLAPSRFAPGCTQVDLALRPAPWTEGGEKTGTCWFDDLSFREAGGPNLIADPSFETGSSAAKVVTDWTAFDQAASRYLDDFGFSSFRLPIQFLPWGRTPEFHKGQIGRYSQGSPEYERLFKDYLRQLQDHLEQKGWLDKAYIYWFDEPELGDYQFCLDTFRMLQEAAPKITRMLTEQPEPALLGPINLWCPVTPNYSAEACQARQKLGERIWWYVCCGPKAPMAGLFIDHGATELRTWMWQTWQNKVQGCLIWESTWWDSTGSPKRPQNPWTDPMGWTPEGGCWGNGDGRFIYPANRDYPNDKAPYVEGPVDSIRWEMLREGLEDYEYLYLLREAIEKKVPGAAAYAKLLEVPPSISEDLSHFCREPQPIYAQRAKIAAALEKLNAGK